MKGWLIVAFAFAIVPLSVPHPAQAADRPADRVVAMYFHRTERCPTCQTMGSYAEEAVRQGFAERIRKGNVEFHFIDFQDQKNAALTKGYQVSGPALIVAKIADNKVSDYRDLEDIWLKVRDKPEFIKYVRSNVEQYLK
jgi:hypothetical protein